MNSFQEEIYLGKKEKERGRNGRGKRMIDREIRREGRKREKEERGRMEEEGRMGGTKEKRRQGERVVGYRLRICTVMERSSARKTLEMPCASR